MKTTLQLCILLFGTIIAKATIHRCNNNPGVTGTHQTLYSALLAASPGDTIHLEPSPYSYGQIGSASVSGTQQFINKDSITFIGNGLDLSEFPGNQSDTLRSKLDYFLYPGNYCSFYGIDCSGPMFIFGNHVLLENCRWKYLRFYNDHNKINHCHIPALFTSAFNVQPSHVLYFSTFANDIEISNSFFTGGIHIDSNSVHNITFINNVFDDTLLLGIDEPSKFYNTTFINNIFKSDLNTLDTTGNNTFINNVCLSNSMTLSSSNGNISSVNPTSVFANPESRLIMDQQVLPTFSVQNVGMFSGADPFIPGRSAPIPSISELVAPNVIQSNTGTITISTKSNQ